MTKSTNEGSDLIMRILLNTDSLTKPCGGIGRYTRHLLKEFLVRKDVQQLYCFQGFHLVEGDHYSESMPEISHKNHLVDTAKRWARSVPYLFQLNVRFKRWLFQRRTEKLNGVIYHEPNYILKPFEGPTVTTIHDLSHLRFPQYHRAEGVRNLERYLSDTVSRANHIITDSEFIRGEVIQELGVTPDRVTAIPLGVDDAYRPMDFPATQAVLDHYNLAHEGYLLSVSTLEPRKNIDGILNGYMQLDRRIRKNYPLVLVGGSGWKNRDLMERIKDLSQQGEVVQLGFVPDADLPYLYAGARAIVFIPFYEGFGLPALEAMASGVPLLGSNVASVPEVASEAGLLVNPECVNEIKEGLAQVLLDEDWRKRAIERGLARAKLFTWSRCAAQTVNIYKKVLGLDS